jgi:hypothetical protein
MPNQNPENPFPAWRLPKGMIKACDDELERSIGSCEQWEWFGGGLVVVGVFATVVIAVFHPLYDSFLEQWGSAIADVLVGIGVAIEIKFGQMAGLRQNELKSRSDKKVSEANERASNAQLETERLKVQFAGRRLSKEQRSAIAALIRDPAASCDVLIHFQSSDPEAFAYGSDIVEAFNEAGVAKIEFGADSLIFGALFGVWVSAEDKSVAILVAQALKLFDASVGVRDIDRSTFRPADKGGPDLYIFVGPKSTGEPTIVTVNAPATREPNI